jgi:hypothetical protein
LRWEIALAIWSDNIVWVNGPYPCGKYADLKIFKEDLAHVLNHAKEKCIADGTYRHFTVSQKGMGNHLWRKHKNRFRARQESVNSRIKVFNCFVNKWRHSHELHKHTMHVAIYLTQISIEYNPLMEAVEVIV